MSKIATLKCDRCGKEIANPYNCYDKNYALGKYSAKIVLWQPNSNRGEGGQRIDLCADCYEKFINFLETEEI